MVSSRNVKFINWTRINCRLLTKFNYLEAAGALALLFTTSTLFNNALPPLHKDIYIKAVKNKIYNFREIL